MPASMGRAGVPFTPAALVIHHEGKSSEQVSRSGTSASTRARCATGANWFGPAWGGTAAPAAGTTQLWVERVSCNRAQAGAALRKRIAALPGRDRQPATPGPGVTLAGLNSNCRAFQQSPLLFCKRLFSTIIDAYRRAGGNWRAQPLISSCPLPGNWLRDGERNCPENLDAIAGRNDSGHCIYSGYRRSTTSYTSPVLQWHLTDRCPACSLGTLKICRPARSKPNQPVSHHDPHRRPERWCPSVLSAVLPVRQAELAGAMASCCEPLPRSDPISPNCAGRN